MLESIEDLGDGTTVLSGGTALLWIETSFFFFYIFSTQKLHVLLWKTELGSEVQMTLERERIGKEKTEKSVNEAESKDRQMSRR